MIIPDLDLYDAVYAYFLGEALLDEVIIDNSVTFKKIKINNFKLKVLSFHKPFMLYASILEIVWWR